MARAARAWGAEAGSPAGVVSALAELRNLWMDSEPDELRPALRSVFDHIAVDAVDASSRALRLEARTDPLTGCANRRALDEDLAPALASARRWGLDLAVVALDLDGLKSINDTYGHAAGDAALLALVACLKSVERDTDTLYRVGGDEFVLMAPFTSESGANELMNRAERAPSAPAFSWGVATLEQVSLDTSSLTGHADMADSEEARLLICADRDLYDRRRLARTARPKRRTGVAAASLAGAAAVGAAVMIARAALPSSPTGQASRQPSNNHPGGSFGAPFGGPFGAPWPGTLSPVGISQGTRHTGQTNPAARTTSVGHQAGPAHSSGGKSGQVQLNTAHYPAGKVELASFVTSASPVSGSPNGPANAPSRSAGAQSGNSNGAGTTSAVGGTPGGSRNSAPSQATGSKPTSANQQNGQGGDTNQRSGEEERASTTDSAARVHADRTGHDSSASRTDRSEHDSRMSRTDRTGHDSSAG